MNKINTFDEFLHEVTITLVSGTRAGSTTSLDRKKYELKKDVKGAKIGSYHNVLLPKGTIITNNPGGVFANHDDLKKKYCTGYGAERWDSSFGVMITQLPEVLVDIEKNSKVLESVSEASKFSSHGFTFTIMGSQDSKGSFLSFLPDSKTLDTYSKQDMANWIDSVFNNMEYFRDCVTYDEKHVAAGLVFRINATYLADTLLKEFKG